MAEIFKTFDQWWKALGYFLTLKTQRKDAAYYGWHGRDGEVAALRDKAEQNRWPTCKFCPKELLRMWIDKAGVCPKCGAIDFMESTAPSTCQPKEVA